MKSLLLPLGAFLCAVSISAYSAPGDAEGEKSAIEQRAMIAVATIVRDLDRSGMSVEQIERQMLSRAGIRRRFAFELRVAEAERVSFDIFKLTPAPNEREVIATGYFDGSKNALFVLDAATKRHVPLSEHPLFSKPRPQGSPQL